MAGKGAVGEGLETDPGISNFQHKIHQLDALTNGFGG
jgi:hypothetical protein